MQDLNFYLALPYTRILKREGDGTIVASILELPGCVAHGDDDVSAIEHLKEVQALWLQESLEAGIAIPVPEVEEPLPSGKWVQRVSRSLHRALVDLAKREDVSLNQLVATILAEAVGRRKAIAQLAAPSVERFEATKVVFQEVLHRIWAQRLNAWHSFGEGSRPSAVSLDFMIESLPKSGKSQVFRSVERLHHTDKRETANVGKR